MRILFYLLFFLICCLTACHKKVHVQSSTNPYGDTAVYVGIKGEELLADSVAAVPEAIQSGVQSPYYNSQLYLDLFIKEVDYYAKDLTLGCVLEMDFEKEFRFTEPDGTHYIFLPVKGVQLPASNLTTYTMVSGMIKLIITIEKIDCRESQTGVIYPFRTFVHIENGAAYNGYSICGFYVLNPRLNDIWVLESINGTAPDRTNYPAGIPTLELHIDGMKVLGFGGCNQISGTFYTEKRSIVFDQLTTTLMDCPNSSRENDFVSILSGPRFTYRTEAGGRLVFTHPDQTTIVFVKIE